MTMRQVALSLATVGAVFALAFGVLAGCGASTANMDPDEVAKAVSPEVSEASVREHLEHLTGVSPVSLPGGKETTISERGSEKGRRAAAEYMKESFEEAGGPARTPQVTPGRAR